MVKFRKSREKDSIVGKKKGTNGRHREKVYRTDSVVEATDKVAELRKPGIKSWRAWIARFRIEDVILQQIRSNKRFFFEWWYENILIMLC